MERTFTMELAGKTITVEIGKYAEQASGTCLIRCGDTALLVCATGSKEPREGIDFFPLTCDYEEKMYAVGKIPGGFIRREGRPSEKAVLTCRLMDRPLRPLFPKGFHHDVQVVATALSVDTDIPPEIYAMNGASIALSISHLPFMGPIGAVSVGYVDGTYIVNPDMAQREASRLDLTVAGTKDAVMMVEAGANEMTEQEMLDAILFGHEAIKEIVAFIEEIQREVGKEKMEVLSSETNGELAEQVEAFSRDKIAWSLDTFDRVERQNREDAVKKEVLSHFEETYPECAREIDGILYNLNKEMVRKRITQEGIRPDGRTTVEVRPIWGEVSVLKRPHGSAVFTRGQTQVMTVMTLGPMSEVQKIDGLSEEEFKRYMHQYNMPPYSVGEARPMRGPGRREIGHGALASRALEPMIPSIEEFPYALRLVSEVISSNGSTSMASVCASTMALMDGGVPIKKPVAGVAMGLIQDSDDPGHITVLTDIQGLEDFLGDMDFKVAGTRDGITAIQMDIKIRGISREILETALAQAKEGRMHILGKMMEVIDIPRESLSEYAPKIIIFKINPEKIGEVVGPRGKNINRIIAETGVKVDIEDDGTVYIATNDDMAAATARKMIETVAKEVEVGETYLGTVVRIMPFGAFVELSPGKDGLVHISKLAKERVNKVEDVVNIGDEILVKVVEIDEKGRINLTRKDLLPD